MKGAPVRTGAPSLDQKAETPHCVPRFPAKEGGDGREGPPRQYLRFWPSEAEAPYQLTK